MRWALTAVDRIQGGYARAIRHLLRFAVFTLAAVALASLGFIVFLVVFIDLLGFGIVLPLLPRVAKTYLADVPEAAQGAILGLLLSAVIPAARSSLSAADWSWRSYQAAPNP